MWIRIRNLGKNPHWDCIVTEGGISLSAARKCVEHKVNKWYNLQLSSLKFWPLHSSVLSIPKNFVRIRNQGTFRVVPDTKYEFSKHFKRNMYRMLSKRNMSGTVIAYPDPDSIWPKNWKALFRIRFRPKIPSDFCFEFLFEGLRFPRCRPNRILDERWIVPLLMPSPLNWYALKVPSHQIRLGWKWYDWIGLGGYKVHRWVKDF